VSVAETFLMARTMFRLEKYVIDMDMNPNFMRVSVDCINWAACCLSF
jgi:hypothetical protein